MTRTTKACPHCDGTHILKLVQRDGWRCHLCKVDFPDPVTREAKNNGPDAETVLKRLAESD